MESVVPVNSMIWVERAATGSVGTATRRRGVGYLIGSSKCISKMKRGGRSNMIVSKLFLNTRSQR